MSNEVKISGDLVCLGLSDAQGELLGQFIDLALREFALSLHCFNGVDEIHVDIHVSGEQRGDK